MISKLFEKSDGLSSISIKQDDAVKAEWGYGYDLVIVAANILNNIISAEDQVDNIRQFIRKAYESLKSGGYMYLDNDGYLHPEKVFNRPGTRIIFDGTDSYGVNGRYILVDSVYDSLSRISSGKRRWELTVPGEETYIKEETYSKFKPQIQQIENLVVEIGFEIVYSYGDYSANPIGENTNRAIYWVRKPE